MDHSEQILQDLPCGCIVFRGDGKITFANQNICEVLGYTPDEILDIALEGLLTISSRIFYQTHFFPLLKLKGQVNEIFMTMKPKTGDSVPVLINAKSTHGDGLESYIGVFTAVWERQKYEEELLLAKKAQQKALEENEALILLQNQLEFHQQQLDKQVLMLRARSDEYMQMGKVLTHDMQEPIRKIAFFFEALLERKQIQQDSQDLRKVEIITKSVLQLRRRTDALFDFVNLHSLSEEFSYLLVDDLILEAEAEVKRLMDFTDFTIVFGNIPGFFGLASQLKRMFVELIKNAVQNRKLDTPLVIRVHAVEIKENAYQASTGKYKYTAHLKIEFSDNGTGFDGQYASYVFGLLNKLNKNSDSVGLGLTLCKQIVSLHNGTIKARSNPGEGTSFTITVPVEQSN